MSLALAFIDFSNPAVATLRIRIGSAKPTALPTATGRTLDTPFNYVHRIKFPGIDVRQATLPIRRLAPTEMPTPREITNDGACTGLQLVLSAATQLLKLGDDTCDVQVLIIVDLESPVHFSKMQRTAWPAHAEDTDDIVQKSVWIGLKLGNHSAGIRGTTSSVSALVNHDQARKVGNQHHECGACVRHGGRGSGATGGHDAPQDFRTLCNNCIQTGARSHAQHLEHAKRSIAKACRSIQPPLDRKLL